MSDQSAVSPHQNSPGMHRETDCYLPHFTETTLHGAERSVVLFGPPDSGKTTLMRRLRQAGQSNLFFIDYPAVHWPANAHTPSHTDSIMGCAADALGRFLSKNPDGLASLTPVNLEYVRWLLEKYLGGRASRVLADTIRNETLLALTDRPYQDLYPTNRPNLYLRGQISELVTVVRRLGFDAGVAVLVDIDSRDAGAPAITDDLPALFDWLEIFELDGFAFKIALPESLAVQAGLATKFERLVTPIRLHWEVADCRKIADCHLAQDGHSLAKLAEPSLLAGLEAQLCVTCGGPTPIAWTRLAHHLLAEATANSAPLPPSAREAILCRYFRKHISLKLDTERRGVWRGAEFIALTEQPFSVLRELWRLTGRPDVSLEARDAALMRIAGKRGNLNTIARRLRENIEPDPNTPIYLHNTRAEGYWLECIEPLQ